MKRETFLGAAAAAAVVSPARTAASGTVSVAYAGSLVTLMEKSLGPAFSAGGTQFAGEAKGSTAIANLIRGGLRTPDVFVSADTAAIESLFGTGGSAHWYATFATTRMQIAYGPKSAHADSLADAASGKRPWYDVLALPGLSVARTDPAQDPKGYRVLLVCELAAALYRRPTLTHDLLGDPENPAQILPEESAAARLETGDVDALWAYSVETASRGYRAIELDPRINLGDPAHAADYASARVTVGAKTYTGAPIAYAVTIPANAPNPDSAAAFVEFLLSQQGRELALKAGLAPVRPIVGGDPAAVPPGVAAAIDAIGAS